MEVNASNTGVGAILSQRLARDSKVHPCAFYSHRLSPAKQSYDIGNKELLAIKLALEEWRQWLEGTQVPFQVWTDHKNLEYLQTAKRLNSRQSRWALFFSRFNFHLTYRPGSKNVKPDALSRYFESSNKETEPDTILRPEVFINAIEMEIERTVKAAQGTEAAPSKCPEGRLLVPNNMLGLHPGYGNTPTTPPTLDFVTSLPPSNHNTTILTIIDRFSKAVCVWLSTKDIPIRGGTRKLVPRILGPFTIL